MTEESTAIEIVFVGRRLLSDGKLGEAWIPLALLSSTDFLNWADLNAKVSLFGGKSKHSVVGGIYAATGSIADDGRLKTLGARTFQRLLDNEQARLAFSARDESNFSSWKAAHAQKKLAGSSQLETSMKALQGAYYACHPSERPAFELAVLRYMRGSR